VATSPAIELHDGEPDRRLRPYRLRIALAIGLVESLLVLVGGLGWFWVLALAAAAVALHVVVGRRTDHGTASEITWILAVSQLIAVLVPVLWVLVKGLAIVALVVMAGVLLAMLLLDRR
jgi:hypothetical protein